MLISVIIPYKNAEKYIKRCTDSLVGQSGNFEFIFVNDNSTDRGKDILSAYNDERIKRTPNLNHEGVSGARNTGLEMAAGDWITFLDADDELLPNAWNKLQKMLKTEAEIHQANHLRRYTKKKVTLRKWANPDGTYRLPALPEMWAPVWNKLYKADLAKGVRFKEGMQFGEDEIYNLECIAKAKEIHNTAVDTVRHNLENTESLSHIKTDRDVAELIKANIDMIPLQDDPAIRTAIYNNVVMHLNAKWMRDILLQQKNGAQNEEQKDGDRRDPDR